MVKFAGTVGMVSVVVPLLPKALNSWCPAVAVFRISSSF